MLFPSVLFYSTACPGLPETPSIVSDIPPNSNLSWSPPSASGAWSYTYEVSWTNGSIIVSRQAGTTGQITGLQAETEYTVEITAYPDSTLCPDQSTTFSFMTDQSNLKLLYSKSYMSSFFCEVFSSSVVIIFRYSCRVSQPCTSVQWSSHSAARCCQGELDSYWFQ